jgi:ATP-dependent HslUV protease ATP-binding subunit HslU
MRAEVAPRARELAEQRLLERLLPPQPTRPQRVYRPGDPAGGDEAPAPDTETEHAEQRTRELLMERLRSGALDEKEVEISVREAGGMPMMQVFSNSGMEEMGMNLQELFGKMMPQRRKQRKVTVAEARKLMEEEEVQELIDMDAVTRRAVERVENMGIVFLDEIDKIAGRGAPGHGPDVSREGVQRDILPIVEGSTVITKYGPVRTDHILFIAAGAFHMAKVSDLIPELQGRFPIRVELQSLAEADFERILLEPRNSLLRQYEALLGTEGVELRFHPEAVAAIAAFCARVNRENEDIGARRLHTVLEYLLEPIAFEPVAREGGVEIGVDEVKERLQDLVERTDLSRFVL